MELNTEDESSEVIAEQLLKIMCSNIGANLAAKLSCSLSYDYFCTLSLVLHILLQQLGLNI